MSNLVRAAAAILRTDRSISKDFREQTADMLINLQASVAGLEAEAAVLREALGKCAAGFQLGLNVETDPVKTEFCNRMLIAADALSSTTAGKKLLDVVEAAEVVLDALRAEHGEPTGVVKELSDALDAWRKP